MTVAKIVAAFASLALLVGVVFTQDVVQEKKPKGKGDTPPAEAKPPTFKVEVKPFKIELSTKGILEAEESAEIVYRPQPTLQMSASHGPMTIRTIVDHGTKVKKGDLLVAFDTTKINEVIEDLQRDRKSVEANLKLASEELPLFEKSVPVDLAVAETAKKRADEELKYFLEVGRPETEKRINMSLKSEKFYMEYAQEELRQLEKMYKANDLTEETEKMILRRQQNSVEMATFWYQQALVERDYVMKYTLPNREKSLKESQVRAELQLDKAQKTLAPALAQKQISLAKMRSDFEKSAQRLEKLLKDRAAMTINSPIDGVVYHGKFARGNWNVSEAAQNRLIPNGMVQPEEVFLTVVKPLPVMVQLNVEEKNVHLLKPGLQGKATLTSNPDCKLPVRVSKVSSLPSSPGKFDAHLVLEGDTPHAALMPGMACTVKFVPYLKKDAIAVPNKALHEEDDKHLVYVLGKDGKHETRQVTIGRTDGDHTEILTGLHEGEEILLERPKPKAADKGKGVTR